MATDLTIVLPDRPGALMAAWTQLRDAGINIEGACGFPQAGQTWVILHIMVTDGDVARKVVEEAGFQVVAEREVDVHQVDNRPGALAEVFSSYAEEGKNVDLMYMAAEHRVVIGTDDRHEKRPGYTTLGEKRH
ncbi:MAG: hypothetical protein ACLGHL_05125 [Actinomycetota bacterium]